MDDLDHQIVACLVDDGRATFSAIGDRVGLSAPAVKRRVDRLLDDGVIRRFTAVLDPSLDGVTTEAFVELFCRGRTNPGEIRAIVAHMPEVLGAWTVTGDADALVRIRTAGTAELETTLERIRDHPQIERTRSVLVLSALLGA